MTTHAGRFWTEMERHHDLAEAFEHHVTVDHPQAVDFCYWCRRCPFHASDVEYPTYDGPRVDSLK